MKNKLIALMSSAVIALMALPASADTYKVDTEGMHAFIQFRVKHLGYSWLYGRFNEFSGTFDYDEKSKTLNNINVLIDVDSLNTNHAERDKHIRSDDFLHTAKHPTSSFKVTSAQVIDGKGVLLGDLTMLGVTKEVSFDVEFIGGGEDPWGGYRQGFQAEASIQPADFGLPIADKLGKEAASVDLIISIEGIRQ